MRKWVCTRRTPTRYRRLCATNSPHTKKTWTSNGASWPISSRKNSACTSASIPSWPCCARSGRHSRSCSCLRSARHRPSKAFAPFALRAAQAPAAQVSLQLHAQQVTGLLRIGLALAGLHDLADQRVKSLVLAGTRLRHMVGVGGQHRVDDLLERAAVVHL